ncbi:MAG: hypothetical protein NTX99_05505, partial [Candidatus Aminicenantes bacterium]|nr:hypothetical protein [Candidatus Aminicenantes bacterium]
AGRRLVLSLPPDPAKGARAQDIVREIFGIEDPVYVLRRDAVVLKTGGGSSAPGAAAAAESDRIRREYFRGE